MSQSSSMSESKEPIASETSQTPPNNQDAGQDTVESLKKRIQELENQVSEKDKKYVYLYADLENLKKRTSKERTDLLKFGWESIAREILHTLDNLERAIAHTSPQTDKTLIEGLNLVLSQLKNSLKKQGLEEISTQQADFDPNFHEAVAQESSLLPSGKIIKEHSRGYTLHGRLLRPARVVVSSGQSEGN